MLNDAAQTFGLPAPIRTVPISHHQKAPKSPVSSSSKQTDGLGDAPSLSFQKPKQSGNNENEADADTFSKCGEPSPGSVAAYLLEIPPAFPLKESRSLLLNPLFARCDMKPTFPQSVRKPTDKSVGKDPSRCVTTRITDSDV